MLIAALRRPSNLSEDILPAMQASILNVFSVLEPELIGRQLLESQ